MEKSKNPTREYENMKSELRNARNILDKISSKRKKLERDFEFEILDEDGEYRYLRKQEGRIKRNIDDLEEKLLLIGEKDLKKTSDLDGVTYVPGFESSEVRGRWNNFDYRVKTMLKIMRKSELTSIPTPSELKRLGHAGVSRAMYRYEYNEGKYSTKFVEEVNSAIRE